MKSKLRIPFSIPILGEAFIDTNNPTLFSTISFIREVEISLNSFHRASLPIFDKFIKKVMEKYLTEKGFCFEVNVIPSNDDFLSLTSILYSAYEFFKDDIIDLMDKLHGASLITLMRALTSLSGGFVIFRKSEGAISIDGSLDSAILINIKNRRKFSNKILKRLANDFPELYQPILHTIGHLTIEGGKAIRRGDFEKLGRLLSIESGLSLTLGLIKPKELLKISKIKNIYGAKVISAGDIVGHIILTPKDFSQYGAFQKYYFIDHGVTEIE
ncbi:MAG: hypothetical protein NZ922_01380 [Candidatus Methanomethyliaceae archaeon]|nr:hypothetical protein [Candidatus Methanomethyliaceae archaeon]MCX8170304.1 hypothetical protein [Candidatus Methanomethyliaceae archaeon]MDW7970376.1 hypothetical protein [Nitrososphaerota archaeon]